MATITSLGFSIWSKFKKDGIDEADHHLSRLEKRLSSTNQSFRAAAGQASVLSVAMMALGPSSAAALSTVAVGATAVAVNVGAAGTAVGLYGGVLSATVKRVTEMKDAGTALNATQQGYVDTVTRMTDRWNQFLSANESRTLSVARDAIDGIRVGIGKLQPIMDATHPVIKRTSEAWRAWMDSSASTRFVDSIVQYGTPALDNFMMAGRNMLAVFGQGFRDFLPVGVGFSEMFLRLSLVARNWAENGGFQKFIAYARDNAPLITRFLEALTGALLNVSMALADTGPSLLKIITAMLELVASMPTQAIQALFMAFVSLKVIIVVVGWIGQLVAALRVLGVVVGAFTSMMAILTTGVKIFIVQLRIMAFALGIGLGPMGLIIAAIAAVIAAIVWIATETTWFQDAWRWTWNLIKSVAEAVSTWFVNTWSSLWNGTKAVASAVWDWIKSAWSSTVDGVTGAGQSVVDWFRSWWNPTWDTVKSVAEAVWSALKTGWNAVTSFFLDAYRGFVQPVIDAWRNVWPELQRAFENVGGVISHVWKSIVAAIMWAWSVIEPIISVHLKMIWSVIKAVFESIWTVIKTIMGQILAVIEFTWDLIWNAVKFAVGFIVTIVTTAWDLIFAGVRFFASVFMSIWEPLWTVVSSVVLGIWNVIKAAWRLFVDTVEAVLLTFIAIFTGNWGKAWQAIKDVAESVVNVVKVAWLAFIDFILAIGRAGMQFLTSLWEAAWRFVGDFVRAIWDGIMGFLNTTWDAIKGLWSVSLEFLSTVWSNVWNGIREFITTWWTAITTAFTVALDFIKNLWNTAWDSIKMWFIIKWQELQSFYESAFVVLRDAFNILWESVKAIFNGFWNWLRDTFWNPVRAFLVDTIPNAFRDAVAAIGRFWDGLKEMIRGPVQWIIDVVWNNGLVKGWNWINDLWDGKDIQPFTFASGGGVTGGGGGMQAFRDGGPVRGPGTGTSDSIPARLSRGEHVWTAREVAAAGGHGAVAAMRSSVLGGERVRALGNTAGFAEGGGVLGDLWRGATSLISPGGTASLDTFMKWADGMRSGIANGAGGFATKMVDMAKKVPTKALDAVLEFVKNKLMPVMGGTAMGWQQMWDIVRGAFPDSVLTSSLRQGDPGYHGSGNAIDVAYPMTEAGKARMLELNKWIATRYPQSTELIHTPGINLKNGQATTYSAATRAGHYDHVHWAMAGGPGGGTAGGVPGNVESWRGLVTQELAHFGQAATPALVNLVLRRLNQESGGNPRAINNWDINAQNGVPSKGLMQVIDPTFAAFRNTSMHPNDIWDPGANMHASMNYAMSRYGSLESAYGRAGGYMLGTPGALKGIATVAENGPELITRGPTPVQFRGGERVWNSSDTKSILGGRSSGDINVKFDIDMRGATTEAVDRAKTDLVPELTRAVERGVGRALGRS